MPMRTTETTVTFKHPFILPEFEGPQPAGAYRLVTDEEEILRAVVSRLSSNRDHVASPVSNDIRRAGTDDFH